MLLHDSLFEPRHRLLWLHCELLPQLPPQTRCRRSPAPTHTYIAYVFWRWCLFTARVYVGLFTIWCSVVQDSNWMLRTGVVFPTRSSFMQKTYSVNGERMSSACHALCCQIHCLASPQICPISLYGTVCSRVLSSLGGQTFLSPVLPSTAVAASAGWLSACVTATCFPAVLDVSWGCRQTFLYISANELVC